MSDDEDEDFAAEYAESLMAAARARAQSEPPTAAWTEPPRSPADPPAAVGMTSPLELVPASPADSEQEYRSPTDFEREYDAFVRLAPPAVQAPARPSNRAGSSTAELEALYAAFEQEIRTSSLSPAAFSSSSPINGSFPPPASVRADPTAALLAASDAVAAADAAPPRRRAGKKSREMAVYDRLQVSNMGYHLSIAHNQQHCPYCAGERCTRVGYTSIPPPFAGCRRPLPQATAVHRTRATKSMRHFMDYPPTRWR